MTAAKLPFPDGENGENHEPDPLIPKCPSSSIRSTIQLHVEWEDYPAADGTCVRDYVHVGDLCRTHLLALQFLQSGGDSTVLNLGNGQGYSVRQILQTIESVTGQPLSVTVGSRRPGDPA